MRCTFAMLKSFEVLDLQTSAKCCLIPPETIIVDSYEEISDCWQSSKRGKARRDKGRET